MTTKSKFLILGAVVAVAVTVAIVLKKKKPAATAAVVGNDRQSKEDAVYAFFEKNGWMDSEKVTKVTAMSDAELDAYYRYNILNDAAARPVALVVTEKNGWL